MTFYGLAWSETIMNKQALEQRAANIRLLILDIDGVMTDGRLYIGPDGAEFKAVSVRDGHGIKMAQREGITIAVISGRPSSAMQHRLAELGVNHVFLAVKDKLAVFNGLLQELGIKAEEAAFMGDDLPDLQVMDACGLGLTVADAAQEVLDAADWVSDKPGGGGAIRQAAEWLIRARDGQLSAAQD